jgi:hypothetical protein
MPPCAAMPLTAAPIPCSRTPKKTLRPAFSLVNLSLSGKIVLVDSVRSAAPPSIVGVRCSKAAMILPPAERVATSSPGSNVGRLFAIGPSGRSFQPASHSAASSTCSLRHPSKRSRQAAWVSAPRSGPKASYTPSGTWNVASGSTP